MNRNNIVILHLIQIQKRLFLIGFTINIIQLEMIKETIVKPYRFTQGFYPNVSLFLYLNREANQNNPVSFLLYINLHFCSKKAEQHFPWRNPPHSHPCAFPARPGYGFPSWPGNLTVFSNTTLSEFRWRGWGCPLFLTSYCSVVWAWTSPSQRFFPCLHRIGVRNATGAQRGNRIVFGKATNLKIALQDFSPT